MKYAIYMQYLYRYIICRYIFFYNSRIDIDFLNIMKFFIHGIMMHTQLVFSFRFIIIRKLLLRSHSFQLKRKLESTSVSAVTTERDRRKCTRAMNLPNSGVQMIVSSSDDCLYFW